MLKLFRFKTDLFRTIPNRICSMNTVSQTVEQVANSISSLKRKAEQQNETESQIAKKSCPEVERVKRRKVALVLAYSGKGYLGLQRNPERKTIEEDLLVALKNCNAITEEIFKQPQLIQFQRAARTDKGVSALRQIISLKLPEEAKVEEINEHLPEQIRVIAIRRVTKGFNSKSSCDGRTYSYMLPTFAFSPHEVKPSEDYRIASYIIDRVNDIISMFQGTHNFHNFTSKKKPLDPSAKRYIVSIRCSDPFVIDNMEFATIYIKGQSFMLHQIRKMVGLTIGVVRGLTPPETILKAYNSEKLDIPIAPSSGLVLEEAHYERYNKRYGSDGIHEILDWTEFNQTINTFKKDYIMPSIIAAEKENNSMIEWLDYLTIHNFDVRCYNPNDEPDDENDDDGERPVLDGEPPVLDGLAALDKAARIVESGNLDTLANAAADALSNGNADNKVNKTEESSNK